MAAGIAQPVTDAEGPAHLKPAAAKTDLIPVFKGVAQVQAGQPAEEQLRELEQHACPTCGSCSGLFTANSMNCLCEALERILPGNNTILAGS